MITSVQEALLRYASLAEKCEQGRIQDAEERGHMLAAIGELGRKLDLLSLEVRGRPMNGHIPPPPALPSFPEPDEITAHGTEKVHLQTAHGETVVLTRSDWETLQSGARLVSAGIRAAKGWAWHHVLAWCLAGGLALWRVVEAALHR